LGKLQIDLLGGFEVRLASGQPLPLKGRKAQALVAYLALAPGEPRTRDELVALLWGDRGEEQARSSLRQSLSELRKALGGDDHSPLTAGRDAVSLSATAIEVDVAEFERLIDDGTPAALQQAAKLYRGDLLDGFSVHDPAFEDWLRDKRQHLNERACDALSKLLDHQSVGDTEQAIATARRLLALDPLRESTHRALMRLYVGTGERTLALKQYQACRDLLAAELGVAPDPTTEQLATDIRAGAPGPQEAVDNVPEPRSLVAEPLPLPDKPSIAVLPFTNLSGDPEQEYFVEGITEDIITDLSRFRSLFVIARNSSFTFKGQGVDIPEVGRKLGVQYVVEGSARKAGNRVRVTAQLIEAESGNHIWAERYDRDLEDVFAVQDELVRTIVSTVGGRLEFAGEKRAERLSESDLQAYECVLRANASLIRFTKEANAKARELLERAVELDSRSSGTYSLLATVHWLDWMAYWVEDREKSLALAVDSAKKAVALDGTDSTAYARLGMCHLYHRAFDDARHCFERALMLNPNDYYALGFFGFYLTAVGEIDVALTNFDQSARINPLQPEWFNWLRGIAFFTARRYDEAIAALGPIKDSINEVRGWLTASYAGAGRLDEARAMLEEFLRVAEEDMAVFPGRKVAAWQPFWHGAIEYKNEADFEHLYDALRKAGLED
jgi:TolB-like protein/Tfp pilus assembly protein PilF